MITIDCPICTGEAETDGHLTQLTCVGCGVTVEIAVDEPVALSAAA
jgi:hypothetical protein